MQFLTKLTMAVLLLITTLPAIAAENRLSSHLDADTLAVYYLNVRQVLALPATQRILAWPEIQGLLDEYLPEEARRAAFKETRQGLIGCSADAVGGFSVAAVLDIPTQAQEEIRRAIPDLIENTAQAQSRWNKDGAFLLESLDEQTLRMRIRSQQNSAAMPEARGADSPELRKLMAQQPDDLAWAVFLNPQKAPSQEKNAPLNPWENIAGNIQSFSATVLPGATGNGALDIQAVAFCRDANAAQMLALQAQILLSMGFSVLTKEDRSLANEIFQALSVTPEGNQVRCSLKLSGSQTTRLLDCVEANLQRIRDRDRIRREKIERQLNGEAPIPPGS